MAEVIIIAVTLLFLGWGCFGLVMAKTGSLVFGTFENAWPILPVLALMGFCTGLGVMSVTKLLGLS